MPPKGKERHASPKNELKTPQRTHGGVSGSNSSEFPSAVRGSATSGGKGKGRAVAYSSSTNRAGRARATRQAKATTAVPDIFQHMLVEALSPSKLDEPERPRKRRRVRRPEDDVFRNEAASSTNMIDSDGGDDASVEFEDVLPAGQQQTAFDDSGDSSAEDDAPWEDVANATFSLGPGDDDDDDIGDLDLTLAAEKVTPRRSSLVRRKTVGKAERALRLDVHKMHILCLLSHVDRRNNWCNETKVQVTLQSLLTKQMLECLKPKQSYTQFGKAESVKKGLAMVSKMWESSYRIIAKGMQKSYWAENEADIQNLKLSPDADSIHDKSDFHTAAKELQGSRDVGAQLFCALLRSAGLDVRLVCSLLPLPFSATVKSSAPIVTRDSTLVLKEPTPDVSEGEEDRNLQGDKPFPSISGPSGLGTPSKSRRRLGHPNAADYFMPRMDASPRHIVKPKQKRIRESMYPVFWVEVLDEAHQRWMPINFVDPSSINSARKFEPPASDAENNLSYVVAFEDDGAARDVTRRYAKSFNAKTRRNRVESTDGGEKWWRKTMRFYSRGWKSDLDQIEDTELAAAEAREPMPKSVADFKDHPVYALERHLRRNEVLVNPREVGKVGAGRDSNGGKKLERVFRRRDVKTVKSADGWYRIGREVKVGEQPVKTVAARTRDTDQEDERAGTALYTEDQTELYEAPPVVKGKVPKNSYGNLDVYVSSMVPPGGVHISHPYASRAGRLLGIDYADAVTGFEFRGRHGTAVIKGIVAATEFNEAIQAVIAGLEDEQALAEEEMRSQAALRMWRRFLIGLRIKERVDGYEVEGEEKDAKDVRDEAPAAAEDSGMESEEYVDDGGGGFFPE